MISQYECWGDREMGRSYISKYPGANAHFTITLTAVANSA